MKKNFIWGFTLMALAFSACGTEELDSVSAPVAENSTPTADIEAVAKKYVSFGYKTEEETSLSKTALDDSNHPTVFVENDALAVNGTSDQLVYGADGNFSGTIVEADNYTAVYPFSAASAISDDAVSAVVPSVQKVSLSQPFDPEAHIMVGTATNTERMLEFKQACSFLKFTTEKSCAKIVVAPVYAADKICGGFSVSVSDMAISAADDATSNVTLLPAGDGATEIPAGTYYASLIAGSQFTKGITITLYDSDDKVISVLYKRLAEPKTFARKKIVTLTKPIVFNTDANGYCYADIKVNDEVSFKMAYVQGGTFLMGAQNTEPDQPNYDANAFFDEERPVHSVTLSSYSIGRFEVTQELWKTVMGTDNNPSNNSTADNLPVENVSWDEIVGRFLPALNTMTGMDFRLPAEDEWEFAARGGNKSQGFVYSGSATVAEVAWFWGTSTHEVGTKKANELGLFDMTGNVREWCQDNWYNYGTPDYGEARIIRGGGYADFDWQCRVSYRGGELGGWNSNINTGFRLAL